MEKLVSTHLNELAELKHAMDPLEPPISKAIKKGHQSETSNRTFFALPWPLRADEILRSDVG